jgi:hypothetical protein
MTVRVAVLSVVIFGLFALAYIWASPTLARQHWDSLDYARACEKHGLGGMWANHPLGHVVQCGVVKVSRCLGYQGRALPVMKLFNGVTAAAAGAALFGLMTTMLGTGLLRSAGWAVVFGGTYGVWHYAGTADIYSLSMLLLIVGLGLTVWSFDHPSPGRSLLAGVAFGAATLSHQFGGVVLLVGTIGLLRLFRGHGRRRLVAGLGIFSIAAAMTIVGGYGLLGIRATGSRSPADLLWWVVGHGHDPTYGRFFTLDGGSVALRSAATTLLRGAALWPIHVLVFVVGISGLALSVASAISIRRLPDRMKTIALSCGLQCIVGWLLVVWWEPHIFGKFWLLTLPPLVMWCELALAGLSQCVLQSGRAPSARCTRLLDAIPLLAGVLLLLSTGAIMLRERQPDASFERALNAWGEHSSPDDTLIESGRLTAHLLFWEQRPGTVNLYRIILASKHESDKFVKLREVIEQASRQNRAVLFSPGLTRYYSDDRLAFVGVTRQQVLDFFDQYRREGPLFEYQESDGGDVRPVYRLVVHAK